MFRYKSRHIFTADISVCDGLPMKREDYQVDSETYTQDCVWTESEMSLLWQHYRSEHAEYIKTKLVHQIHSSLSQLLRCSSSCQ